MPTIYQVQAPDGSILEIEGPDNATDEEIAAFAAQQYDGQKSGGITGTLRPDITGRAPGAVIGAVQSGELIMSDADRQAGAAIQEAWNRTGRFEDVAAVAAQFGRRFGEKEAAFLRANEGRPVTINANPTGIPTATEAAIGQALPPRPQTTAGGVFGAMTRGVAPALAGATLGGMVAGPPGAIAGAATATLAPLVGDPIVTGVNRLLGTEFATPTEAMENLFSALGIPEARTEAERVIQSTANAAASATGGVGLGRMLAGAAAPVTAAVGETLAAQPATQIAGGAAGGASAQTAAELGAGPLGQTIAGLVGGMAGGGVVPRPRAPLPSIVGQAEAAGIPLMTSDVVPPRTFIQNNLRMAGERIPIAGTGGARQAQQEARVGAVKDILTDYGALDGQAASMLPARIVSDLSEQRSATIKRYSQAKQEVIDRLTSAGTVPMDTANQRIEELARKLRRRKTREGDEAAQVLMTIRDDLQGRNLFELEAYRRDSLANVFKDDPKRPMSIAVREAGEKALRQIYDPVRQDMGAFIRANGDRRDFNKWMISNERLSEEAGELAKQSLTRVLRQGDATPEVVEGMLLGARRSDVAALYRNLSPRGRIIAQQAIMARVARKAVDGDNVSPEKFAAEVKRLGDNVGVFFNGDERARLEGLARVLQATKRASEAGVVTATGQQNYAPAMLAGGAGLASMFGGGMTGFLGAMTAVGTAGAAARIYESAAVRNLLLQASKTTSQERLIQIAQRLSALEASQGAREQKEPTQ